MGIFSFLTGQADEIITSVGKVIDDTFTSDEERLEAKNKLAKIKHGAKLKAQELANDYEKEISKRWLSDNASLITRLVRPFVVLFLYTLFGAVVLTDGNIGEFSINTQYIPVLQNLLITVTVAYFGSRGIEKVNQIRQGVANG